MSLLNVKREYSKRGPYDELYTPEIAVEMLLPFIPKHIRTIWEPTAISESKIVKVLRKNGYKVVTSHIKNDQDFFTYEPDDYDMIITNPAYSLKNKFLKRAIELDKPFMMLLPLTTLEGIERGNMFENIDLQLIIPNKRFNFIEDKGGSWFQTSWFCHKVNLHRTLNFVKITNQK